MPIPRLIHFVALGGTMPEWADYNIGRFRALNPGWRILVHRDDGMLLPSFRPGYDAIQGDHVWGRRSDLVRVSILGKLGGWYFDWDFLPLRRMADIVADYDLSGGFFLTQGTPDLIANGVIGTTANSPGLRAIGYELARRAARPINRAWDGFGPRPYTDVFTAKPGLAVIGAQEMFYPLQDRADSIAAYRRLRAADYSDDAVEREFGMAPPPYALHMSMMDELTIPEPSEAARG